MKKFSVKTIVAIGIGAALFFVLGRFVMIPNPVVPNSYISVQYGLLAFMAAVFGPFAGAMIGLIGHTLIDLSWGSPWWSWIIASGVFGMLMGFGLKSLKLDQGEVGKKGIVRFNVIQLAAHLVCWVVIASGLDVLMYNEPVSKVFAQGFVNGLSNAVTTAILGSLLCIAYAATQTKAGSLTKE